MSLLDGVDQEPRSYLEIAELIRRFGAQARADLAELWRRMLFNILVSNTDDHLRNHGFLYAGRGGWTLSPAYDLNPVPVEVRPRFLSTAIGEDPNDTTASLRLALEVAENFDLSEEEARSTAVQVAQVTRQRDPGHPLADQGPCDGRAAHSFMASQPISGTRNRWWLRSVRSSVQSGVRRAAL